MSAAWVSGSVRARLLVAERRLGAEGARELGGSATVRDALVALGRTPYRREISLGLGLEEAQRALAVKTLLDLRLLAGWLPQEALSLLRALAGWYELANVEDRVAYLEGAPLRQPFELGGLASAWPRAAGAQSLEELRQALAPTAWGDPGGETPAQLGLGLRLAWAHRVADAAPGAGAWAAGATALLVASTLFVAGLPVEALPVPPVRLLGPAWQAAGTFPRFREALPADAAWALEGVESPEQLWRAEARWWARVEEEGARLLRGSRPGPEVVVGATALLAADAHRASSALAAAARRGLPAVEEAFDAAA
ncbi:MAG TPA: hypothetical protein VLD13_01075 [Gaiellaceae bacterium]|nr:hypothetical protein [Gaiellaceae bacterium]